MRRASRWLAALWLLQPVYAAAQAPAEPLWEAGVGMAVTALPDYRGADEGRTYLLPIPYFTYHGKRLRIDRLGVHADLIERERLQFDVSLSLGPPADSDENRARAGMPDLDLTLEVGPSLKLLCWASERRERTLTLQLPLRAVIATDFGSHWGQVGWVFAPHLSYDHSNFGPGVGWNFLASAGPVYATEKFHDYYYEVGPQFATAARPAFDAAGGYSGMRVTLSMSKRYREFWLGWFVRYDDLDGASFAASPLVRRGDSLIAGIGMSWVFLRSATSASRDP